MAPFLEKTRQGNLNDVQTSGERQRACLKRPEGEEGETDRDAGSFSPARRFKHRAVIPNNRRPAPLMCAR